MLIVIYFPCLGLMLAVTSVTDYRTHASKQVNESSGVGRPHQQMAGTTGPPLTVAGRECRSAAPAFLDVPVFQEKSGK